MFLRKSLTSACVLLAILLGPSLCPPQEVNALEDDVRLGRSVGVLLSALTRPRSLLKVDPQFELDPRWIHPRTGVAADFGAWLQFRIAYEKVLDRQFGAGRLSLTRRSNADPFLAPLVFERRARELDSEDNMVRLMRRALELGDLQVKGARLPGTSLPSAFHALRFNMQKASHLIKRKMLREVPSVRQGTNFMTDWLCRTGGHYSANSREAPVYELGWAFRPSDPYEPGGGATTLGMEIPELLPTMTSTYHLFRALGGEPIRSRGWTDLEREWEERHAVFDEKEVDLQACAEAALWMSSCIEADFLRRLAEEAAEFEAPSPEDLPAWVEGEVLFLAPSDVGTIIVGGPGPNRYTDPDAVFLLDVGGDDVYVTEGTSRPLSVWADLSGDDLYLAEGVGGPAAGVFGVNLLMDLEGDDRYIQGANLPEGDVRQRLADQLEERGFLDPGQFWGGRERPLDSGFAFGAGLYGIGLLFDRGGDDLYVAEKWALGAALGRGVGVLADEGGEDIYVSAALAQGVGVNKGMGMLLDRGDGDDVHQCWGVFRFANEPQVGEPGFLSFGLGAGSSWRVGSLDPGYRDTPTAPGGIGILVNGGGDDRYIGANASLGSGYGGGMGALVDRGGNDHYRALIGDMTGREKAARIAGAHTMGEGSHLGQGLLLDHAGDDLYEGAWQSGGYGWDGGIGFLVDLAGDDRYRGAKSSYGQTLPFAVGSAGAQGFGVLIDLGGKDAWSKECRELADASDFKAQYPVPGGNFSLVLLSGDEPKALPKPFTGVAPGAVRARSNLDTAGNLSTRGLGLFLFLPEED